MLLVLEVVQREPKLEWLICLEKDWLEQHLLEQEYPDVVIDILEIEVIISLSDLTGEAASQPLFIFL